RGGIFGQRFSSSGAKLGAEFHINTYTEGQQSFPAVSSDGTGNFVALWAFAGPGDDFGVFGQRYSGSGATLGAEFRVNRQTEGEQGPAAVSHDAAGNFVVVWNSYPKQNTFEVHGQRYSISGMPVGNEFRIDSSGI